MAKNVLLTKITLRMTSKRAPCVHILISEVILSYFRYAGLYCVVLTGYAKGKDFKPGDSFKGVSNHSWNAVHIDDNWHLVDTKWASITRNNNNSSVSQQ